MKRKTRYLNKPEGFGYRLNAEKGVKGNEKAPLYEALLQYKARGDVSFHVPGHKNGMSHRGDLGGELAQVMKIDVTEITGTDDLHHPEGVIREAQQLAADAYGAEESFFLVGGSTAGNLALILSVCTAPGDVLLVQRNVHKSVIHGLMLAHAHAVFLAPLHDPGSGLATIPSEETVREALRRYPGAKGLLVTHPNYYGMGAPLWPLATLCHAHGVPLLVDEAHGAHFGLHPALPESALQAGADGVVQSTHKMLTALTMGAMLHVQGGLLDRGLLRQRLAMVQSSSPSYPIMASLDLSRSLLQSRGPAFFESALAAVGQLRLGLRQLPRFGLLTPGARGEGSAYAIQDPFKAVLYDATGRWSGYELQERLEAAGCVPEMSDERHVVLALSPATTEGDIGRLLRALKQMDSESEVSPGPGRPPNPQSKFSTWNIDAVSTPVTFGLRPIMPEDKESVSLESSAGRLAAEMIIPYPPGIPLLYPGEEINERVMEQLLALRQAQAKCQGAADPTLNTIQVIKHRKESRERVER
ncbi:arginine/lysine/ornithine decarboxylase [Fontibacillus phaseoli]|uniref:Arginine/lysine/ornithine decarboxylase n=2 Tax=Fontibacillus phaseoli TaxID=1416533 RepID=A0A369AZL0_9BACL|nr:arginine/lysine/ornithine decarboxylase [Fontibacillus phaseoli]